MALRSVKMKNGMKITLSASMDNVDRIADVVKRYLHDVDMSRASFKIVLGIREALLNAVKHGSLENRKKNVVCEIMKTDTELTIRVEDDGDGFEWERYLLSETLSAEETGRGIHIMKKYFESISYSDKGNIITLKSGSF